MFIIWAIVSAGLILLNVAGVIAISWAIIAAIILVPVAIWLIFVVWLFAAMWWAFR